MPTFTQSGTGSGTARSTGSGSGADSSGSGNQQYLTDLSTQLSTFSDQVTQSGVQSGITTNVDWRARLRPKDGGRSLFWKGALEGDGAPSTGGTKIDYLLKPLHETNGLVWQYTPDILLSSQVNYNMPDFHGQNYPLMTYKNTTPPQIPVTADFSANTTKEAQYLLGVIHFLKVCTKSFFGDSAVASGLYGTPPPVMLFEYLGQHGFNKVPVVVTSYSINYPSDVDYVPVKTAVVGDETTFVPVLMNVQVTLQPSYTPHKLRKRFDLQSFTTGKNYKDGFV